MNRIDKTVPSQTESISCEFDFAGPEAELRWRALRLEDDGREARRAAREVA
jgi:hypothetical protein